MTDAGPNLSFGEFFLCIHHNMRGPRSLPPPSKKRKLSNDSKALQSIQDTEQQLTRAVANNGSLNPLADLLDLTCSRKDSQEVSKGIYALYRVFVLVINNGKLSVAGDESTKTVKAWLWNRLNEYVDFLAGLLKDEEKSLRVRNLFYIINASNPRTGIGPSNPLLFTKTLVLRSNQVLEFFDTTVPHLSLPKDCFCSFVMPFVSSEILPSFRHVHQHRRSASLS